MRTDGEELCGGANTATSASGVRETNTTDTAIPTPNTAAEMSFQFIVAWEFVQPEAVHDAFGLGAVNEFGAGASNNLTDDVAWLD